MALQSQTKDDSLNLRGGEKEEGGAIAATICGTCCTISCTLGLVIAQLVLALRAQEVFQEGVSILLSLSFYF